MERERDCNRQDSGRLLNLTCQFRANYHGTAKRPLVMGWSSLCKDKKANAGFMSMVANRL